MIHGNYRPLIESDMWPIELCYRQWRWSIILEVVLTIFWYENKCSLLFRSPIVSPGDSVKDDIADDLVWLLVISGTINGFIVCIWKYSMHELPNWNGRTSHVGDYFCCQCRIQLSIEAHTGTPPAADWKRPPGRPRRNWLQQVEEDVGLTVGAAWIAGQDRSMWRTLRPSAGQAQQWVSEWFDQKGSYMMLSATC